jgi:hypothetical protein
MSLITLGTFAGAVLVSTKSSMHHSKADPSMGCATAVYSEDPSSQIRIENHALAGM